MSGAQIEQHFQFLRQQILALQEKRAVDWEAMDAALEDLQETYEQMQTTLEAGEVVLVERLQQKQYYQDLFQFFPMGSFVTNADGVIMEANQTIAQLLEVSRSYLVGQPLAVFVAEDDRPVFQTRFNQLPQGANLQIWQTQLRSQSGERVTVELHLAIARNSNGLIEYLRIGVYNLSQSQPERASIAPLQQLLPDPLPRQPESPLPMPLDGLQVLVVDDEADIREFLTLVLEAHGIGVRAVASAAAALEVLERSRPDVLISDIRMPGEDGYQLIRQIRDREAEQGGHLPAAAITAYLDEDPEKSLQAGFEAHLYKLVQPGEWVEMVAQLVRQSSQ